MKKIQRISNTIDMLQSISRTLIELFSEMQWHTAKTDWHVQKLRAFYGSYSLRDFIYAKK